MRSETEIIEGFLAALVTGSLDCAPLTPDVVVHERGRILGRGDLGGDLDRLRHVIGRGRVERHLVDGALVTTLLTLAEPPEAVSALLCFHLSGGLIDEIRVFYGSEGGEA